LPKILVIEDELNIQKLVKANLAASGYQVFVASDGEEGLGLAKLESPDLILLDLMMPGISGWDVLTALKTNPRVREIPVVIMTASAHKDEEDKARSMGAVNYLVKPFSADELLRHVKQVVGASDNKDA